MFDKKLNYLEDDFGFSVSFSWFTPIAFFLLFFSIAWVAFLVFWYTSVASGGAPWIFFVFPLVHVAVGIGISYYTLCLFFNKTYIDVANGQLSVKHSPVPWWWGDTNLPTESIDQIYVKEKVRSNKGNQTRSYELHAKMMDGTDERVLDIGGLDSQQAKELEHRLEAYLGINNLPVVGEYQSTVVLGTPPEPRRQRRSTQQSPFGFLYQLKAGDNLVYNQANYNISHLSQYDWNNGDSDKTLQLLDDQQNEVLIYLQKNKGLASAFVNQKIPLFESAEIVFLKSAAPISIHFKGKEYLLEAKYAGMAFQSDTTEPVPLEQWFYLLPNSDESIRIVNFKNQMSFYNSKKVTLSQFQTSDKQNLDLPDLDLDYLDPQEDEGYV